MYVLNSSWLKLMCTLKNVLLHKRENAHHHGSKNLKVELVHGI